MKIRNGFVSNSSSSSFSIIGVHLTFNIEDVASIKRMFDFNTDGCDSIEECYGEFCDYLNEQMREISESDYKDWVYDCYYSDSDDSEFGVFIGIDQLYDNDGDVDDIIEEVRIKLTEMFNYDFKDKVQFIDETVSYDSSKV